MNSNTQRKALAAVLVLAGGAWATDHFLIGYSGPASAAAASSSPARPGPGVAASTSPTAEVDPVDSTPLMAKLEALVASGNPAGSAGGDAFSISPAWSATLNPPVQQTAQSTDVFSPTPAASQNEISFNVTMVIRDENQMPRAAVINGQLVNMGESFVQDGEEFNMNSITSGGTTGFIVKLVSVHGERLVPLIQAGEVPENRIPAQNAGGRGGKNAPRNNKNS